MSMEKTLGSERSVLSSKRDDVWGTGERLSKSNSAGGRAIRPVTLRNSNGVTFHLGSKSPDPDPFRGAPGPAGGRPVPIDGNPCGLGPVSRMSGTHGLRAVKPGPDVFSGPIHGRRGLFLACGRAAAAAPCDTAVRGRPRGLPPGPSRVPEVCGAGQTGSRLTADQA